MEVYFSSLDAICAESSVGASCFRQIGGPTWLKCISRVWRPSVQSLLLSFPPAEKGGPTSRMRISRILEAICAESFVSASRWTEMGGLPGGSYFLEHVCKTLLHWSREAAQGNFRTAAVPVETSLWRRLPAGRPKRASEHLFWVIGGEFSDICRTCREIGLGFRTFILGNPETIFGPLPHLSEIALGCLALGPGVAGLCTPVREIRVFSSSFSLFAGRTLHTCSGDTRILF